jgi:dTDP-glucose 4,6-dehydratase
MQNILVTGGAGFIGSNFVRYLLGAASPVRVVTLDALTYAGSRQNLELLPDPGRHSFVHGDICDSGLVAKVLREHAIDTVIHFAAESHVDRSILEPAPFIHTNILGTAMLLDAVREYWLEDPAAPDGLKRFHHISTDEVYGSLAPDEPAWTEESPYAPRSPYAASKAAGDHLVLAYGHTYGLPVTLTACSNNYGPYQFPEKLIPLVILNALEEKPLPLYGDGLQIRDWLHVEDHCEAVYRVLTRGAPGARYHIGGGNQPANRTVAETLCDILDERIPDSRGRPRRRLIEFVPDRPGHDRRYALDTRRIREELGWQPRRTLAQGLRETVDWYVSHPAWVTAARAQDDYRIWLDKNYRQRTQRRNG